MESLEYPTSESIEKLCEDLKLEKPDKYSQNWENEIVVNYSRIKEFIRYYRSNNLDDETKLTLMILIINSLNDFLGIRTQLNNEIWNELLDILLQENQVHMNTILYWAMEEEEELEYVFPITPYIRVVLSEIRKFEEIQSLKPLFIKA